MRFLFPERAVLLLTLCLCAACGSGGGSEVASNNQLQSPNLDTSEVLFDPDRLLQVEIDMDEAYYEQLRHEGRSPPDVFSGCSRDFEYTHFEATVRVDGEEMDRVDIRKKGFLGSLSASRPSIKLNFSTHSSGRRLESMQGMTLNNNRQDPGNTHQCISYQMFRDAGLQASRCNFARVTINGRDLGIYSNIEAVNEQFLSRNFDRDRGNLYEAQGADFGQYTKENFQLKTNEERNDRSDLDMVATALLNDDANLPGALEQEVDLDEFLSYWAMESITGHWDSATGNANNYFVYRDPADERFRYIPWGTDGAMDFSLPVESSGPLFRFTEIPFRLFHIPEWQDRFHTRVLQLLDEVWDEAALDAEVDRIRDLTGTPEQDLAQVRLFISLQEQRIRDAVAGLIPQEERRIVDQPASCDEDSITSVSASFANGTGRLEYVDPEGGQVSIPVLVLPPDDGGLLPFGEATTILMIGSLEGRQRVGLLSIEKAEFAVGEIPLHGVATTLILLGEGESGGFDLLGMAGDGSVVLEAPLAVGQPATGSLSGRLWLFGAEGFLGI